MIEPMIDALTTSCSPSSSANRAMISSGALPKVTLSRPPMPGPERAASSSVARPISAAVGMIPSAEAAKTSRRRGAGEVERDRDRDQRHQQVGPAVGAAKEGRIQPRLPRPRAHLLDHARAPLQVGGGFGVFQTAAIVGRSRATPGGAAGGGGRSPRGGPAAGHAFEQVAEAFAAAGAFEQFDRVDVELLEQSLQRLGAGGGGDVLFLVDAAEREFELELRPFRSLQPFGSIVDFRGELADDVVVADVDLDVGLSSPRSSVRPWLLRVRRSAAGRRLRAGCCRPGLRPA